MDWLIITGMALKLMNMVIFNQAYELNINYQDTLPPTIQTTDSLMFVEIKQDANSSSIVNFFIDPYQDINYQPKTSPDVASDYMPEIIPELALLPMVAQENINELLELFMFYSEAVEKNPGKWVEGNIVLGAKPEEYKPSKEELILGEIGKRISSLLKNKHESFSLEFILSGTRVSELCYPFFTFTHADVMGSGRFFM